MPPALPTSRAALAGVFAMALTACRSCEEPSGAAGTASSAGSAASIGGADAPRVLAVLAGPVDALAADRGVVFGASRARGVVFSLDTRAKEPAEPVEIARGEVSPFAVVARAGRPVWASAEGVFTTEGTPATRRTLLASRTLRALGAGPHDVLFADAEGVGRIEWPQSSKVVRVAPEVRADAVAGTDEAIVWMLAEAGEVWVHDLPTGTRRRLPATSRHPVDLSIGGDGRTALWHEDAPAPASEPPRAFLATLRPDTVRELPGLFAPRDRYVQRAGCVFGPGVCKRSAATDWVKLDPGARDATGVDAVRPTSDDPSSVFWAEPAPEPAAAGAWRVVAASKRSCCGPP